MNDRLHTTRRLCELKTISSWGYVFQLCRQIQNKFISIDLPVGSSLAYLSSAQTSWERSIHTLSALVPMRWLGVLILGDSLPALGSTGWATAGVSEGCSSVFSRIFTLFIHKPCLGSVTYSLSSHVQPPRKLKSRCVPDSVALSNVHAQPESAQRIAASVSASPLNIQFHRRGTSGDFFPGVNAIIFLLDLWGGVRYFKGEVCPMVRSEMGRWAYSLIAALQCLLQHREERGKNLSAINQKFTESKCSARP